MHTLETIVVGNVTRQYVLHIPTNLKSSPDLIISCHPGGSSGPEWWDRTWKRRENQGFIIACPSGDNPVSGTNWVAIGDSVHGVDETQDERFILTLLAHLKAKYSIHNAYMCGFSSGGKMSTHMYVTNSDKFAGFGITGHGLDEQMVNITPPAQTPLHLSFGTADANFTGENDKLDGIETLFWFLDKLGLSNAHTRRVSKGRKTTAKTLLFVEPNKSVLEFAKIVGMPHRWAATPKGDPYYEDDALINFWRVYAGFQT